MTCRLLLVLTLLSAPLLAQSISYVGSGAFNGSTIQTVNMPYPAGIQADDILIFYCMARSTSATVTVSGEHSGDVTLLANVDTDNADHNWWWVRASGSEGVGSECDKGSAMDGYGWIVAFRNVVDTGTPYNVLGSAEKHDSEPMSVTGITSTEASSMIVVMVAYEDNNTASITGSSTDPATYSTDYGENASGGDSSGGIAYAIRTSAGSTGTITIDYDTAFTSGDDGASLPLALSPAGGAAADQLMVIGELKDATASDSLPAAGR